MNNIGNEINNKLDKKEIIKNINTFKMYKYFSLLKNKYLISQHLNAKSNIYNLVQDMNEISLDYLNNGYIELDEYERIYRLKDFSKYIDNHILKPKIDYIKSIIDKVYLNYDFLYTDILFIKRFKKRNKGKNYDEFRYSRRYYMLNVFGYIGNKTNDKKHTFSYAYFVKSDNKHNDYFKHLDYCDYEYSFFNEYKYRFILDVIGLNKGDNDEFFKKKNVGYSILVRPIRYFDVNVDRVSASFVKKMMNNFKPTDFLLFLKKYAYRFNLMPRLDIDIKYKEGVGDKVKSNVVNKILERINKNENLKKYISEIYVSSSGGLHLYTYVKENVSLKKTKKYLGVNLAVLTVWITIYKEMKDIIDEILKEDKYVSKNVKSITIDNKSFDIKQGFYFENIKPYNKNGYSYLLYRSDEIEKQILKTIKTVNISDLKKFFVNVEIDENVKKYIYENLYKLFDITISEFENKNKKKRYIGNLIDKKSKDLNDYRLNRYIVDILKNPDDYLKGLLDDMSNVMNDYIKDIFKNKLLVIKRYSDLTYILEQYVNEIADYLIEKLKEEDIYVDYIELKSYILNVFYDNLDRYIMSLISKSLYNKALKTTLIYYRHVKKSGYDFGSFTFFNILRYGIELYIRDLNIIKDEELAKEYSIMLAKNSIEKLNSSYKIIDENKLYGDILPNLDKYGKNIDIGRDKHINLIDFVRRGMMMKNKNFDTFKLEKQELIDILSTVNEVMIDGIIAYVKANIDKFSNKEEIIDFLDKAVNKMKEISIKRVKEYGVREKYKKSIEYIVINRLIMYYKKRFDEELSSLINTS